MYVTSEWFEGFIEVKNNDKHNYSKERMNDLIDGLKMHLEEADTVKGQCSLCVCSVATV